MKSWLSRLHHDYVAAGAVVLLNIIVHWPWLKPWSIFTSGDWWYVSLERYRDFAHISPIWVTDNFGSTSATPHYYFIRFMEGLLTYIGSNFALNEKLFYMWPILIAAPIGVFLLSRLYVGRWFAALGALLYCFNTAFLFNQVGPLTIEMGYALAPLFLYCFLRFVRQPARRLPLVAAAAILSVMVLYELRIALIAGLIAFGLWVYTCLISSSKLAYLRQTILPLVAFGAIVIGTQLFWILPYVISSRAVTFSDILTRSLFVSFSDITNGLTLSHPFWTGARPATFVVQSIPIWSWILPLAAFGYLLLLRRALDRGEAKTVREVHFWAALALAGAFLVKQVNPPFTDAYSWLFDHIPGFSAFRESSKFYLVVATSYAILVPYTLHLLTDVLRGLRPLKRHRIRRWSLIVLPPVLLAAVFLVNSWPLVTTSFRTLFIPRTMPADYQKFNQLVARQSEYFRVLWVPSESRWSPNTATHPKLTVTALQQGVWGSSNSLELTGGTARDKLERLFTNSATNTLLDRAAVKYVAVPVRDLANEDDFFRFYGNDRTYFTRLLDGIPYLKRVDIGTPDLAVYENEHYNAYIAAHGSTQSFTAKDDFAGLHKFIERYLNQPLNAALQRPSDTAPKYPVTPVSDVFGQLELANIVDSTITKRLPTDQPTDVYFNTNGRRYSYEIKNRNLTVSAARPASLNVNDKPIVTGPSAPTPLLTKPLASDATYYLDLDGRISRLRVADGEHNLGTVGQSLRVYEARGVNLVTDGAFESGLWQPKVEDCNPYNNTDDVKMSQIKSSGSGGQHALRLEATRHTACTHTTANLTGAAYYLVSFEYRLNGTNDAAYELDFGGDNPPVQRHLKAYDRDWHKEFAIIPAPAGSTTAQLKVFGYPNYLLEGSAATDYDNVVITPLSLSVNLDQQIAPKYDHANLADGSTLTYPGVPAQNLISNPSFEDGLWRERVGDCNAFDGDPKIGMELSKESRSHGRWALQLRATRHTACTSHPPIPVEENENYLLSFDYQSPNAPAMSYYVSFNDSAGTSMQESVRLSDSKWHNHSVQVKAPLGATAMSVVLYAEATDNRHEVVNRFDNFNLIKVPDLRSQYFLVGSTNSPLVSPRAVDSKSLHPTRKAITIRGATTPFYLSMSESYNSLWRLQFDNAKVHGLVSGLPWAKADAIPDSSHFKLNDFANGWYVDVNQYCRVDHRCQQNADGTYDLRLIAEFTPQRWFHVGALASGATVLALAAGLIVVWRRRRGKQARTRP